MRVARLFLLAGLLSGALADMPSAAWASDTGGKLDCRVYETKKLDLTVGLSAAQFFFNLSPTVGFSREAGVAWDKVVHGTIARYVELCNQYNAGLVSKEEYQARLREIDGIYREAQALEARHFETTRNRAKGATEELDQFLTARNAAKNQPSGTGPKAVSAEVTDEIQSLAERIDKLDPVGRPFDPRTPASPPDPLKPPALTGTSGAQSASPDRQP
jgi:hypothetical protein